MKILMVSMFSSHFFNWVKQLEGQGHTIYWIDVYDANLKVDKISFVHQITGWRNKKDYPGRYGIKKNLPKVYNFLNKFNQRKLSEIFEQKLLEIQPDVVQSFEMFSSCVPVYSVMKKHPQIQWIYNVWGNDMYYFKELPKQRAQIISVLERINYLFSDCLRDSNIATELGYNGEVLGVFPTGGGYDLNEYKCFLKQGQKRGTILIKGYQHQFGRCNVVLEAISNLKQELINYDIVIFGANDEVINFRERINISDWENLKIYKHRTHKEILKLMGESLIYIGNSISDGMPNTLLEAIIMGAFPIQSNPGGATSELVNNNVNGLLINNPEDPKEIEDLILKALNNPNFLNDAVSYNLENIKPKLERKFIADKVIEKYNLIEQNL